MAGRALRFRRAISRSRLAPFAAFPYRMIKVARYDLRVFRSSVRWLVTSREHHNYTYDLTALNREHLAWFVSDVCNVPVGHVREWMAELEADDQLRKHIENTTAASARRGLADRRVRYARRAGWYAMVRALKPAHVVETGTDKGLGTCVIAAALLRNTAEGHPGRVTSLDINPEAGYLTKAEPWASVIELLIGDSVTALAALPEPVDIFLHDSDHSSGHERREFAAVEPRLAKDAIVLTDNVTKTDVLLRHAEATGRRFLAFKEQPARHWYPGDGIGAAWR
ncbi:putative O-methyltransferase YrrM [Allocatelliglobosispora scoriae]|uniref:Putative O-methyltransferase YrrM n=1 Tax=Allocatelliglobosispora scoriae TaxID=643052 RepID=A0A841BTN6_9ACTN|nr:class I SAM-dependent methyltransferase [Allocatelliglobosispora scoriae]MBB5870140.1 putative O-methyltransferase YrrM [Allocatelliglobosispora scoriae]